MKGQRALEVATNVAYLLMVAATLYLLFPGLRRGLASFAQAQVWNFQLGVWVEKERKMPGWKREALEVRGKRKPAPQTQQPPQAPAA